MGDEADTIFVMSRLYTFAHRIEGEKESVCQRLLDLLVTAAGPERTLVMPAFVFSFGKTRKCDLSRDVPDTGVFVHAAIEQNWPRTHRPMFGWVALGPRSDEVLVQNQSSAFGENSVVAWLAGQQARAIGVGITDKNYGWVLVHLAEQMAKVPYRYFKKFVGEFYVDGVFKEPCEEVSYVRPLQVQLGADYLHLTERLIEQKDLWINESAVFPLRAVQCETVLETSLDFLGNDPFSFIPDPDQAKRWIADSREQEIAALAENEQCSLND